jgi:hypothetical protein
LLGLQHSVELVFKETVHCFVLRFLRVAADVGHLLRLLNRHWGVHSVKLVDVALVVVLDFHTF